MTPSVVEAVSGKLGYALDESKLSPNVRRRLRELQTMRGFLDRITGEMAPLARAESVFSQRVFASAFFGLAFVLLGMVTFVSLQLGVMCLGLSDFFFLVSARPSHRSLARKRVEFESIAAAFDKAVERAAREADRDVHSGWA